MTAPPAMSCESCRDLLIELVCDELPAGAAAEVRAHALRCERCGPELEKLSATLRVSSELPLLTPSPEVERRVMQAARDANARRARGPAREASVPAGGRFTAWFARLGSFAMSPQVAMASVLLLVVGIGLYALPLGHDAEPTALRVAEDEAPEEQSAASPAASATGVPIPSPEARQAAPAAADRLEEMSAKRGRALDKASVRDGRMAKEEDLGLGGLKASSNSARAFPESKGAVGLGSENKHRAPAKLAPATKAVGGGERLADDWSDPDNASARRDQAAEAPARSAPKPQSQAPAAEPQKPKRAEAPALGTAASSAGGAAFAPAPPAAPAPVQARESKAEAEAPIVSEVSKKPSAAAAPQGEVARKKEKEGATALSQGVAAVQRGDHSLGRELLLPLISSGTPSERSTARLWLARSLRETGDCARALEHYRVLTQSVTAARAVLEEAADCQERTGNAAAAAKLRGRAALPAKQ